MPNHCAQNLRTRNRPTGFSHLDGRSAAIPALLGAIAVLTSPAVTAAPATVEVVYSFAGGADGKYPQEALIEHAGVLYGTTFNGGGAGDCGTVFGLTRPPSVKTFTHSLSSLNGCGPKSLAVGADGQLYGVNETGGVGNTPAVSAGAAFRITTAGTLTRLHLFDSSAASRPEAGLVAGRDGNFYGTTTWNGGSNGTVFRLTPQAGDNVTVDHLHGFSAAQLSRPGAVPLTKLIEDNTTGGVFYGTTSAAGGVMTAGTVFRIAADGTYRLLHSFSRESERASGPLVQASDGLLYGSTSGGGDHGQGMVFRIATDGTGFQPLHSFNAATDQLSRPNGGLVIGADGQIYGIAGGMFRVTPATAQVARMLTTAAVNSVVGTRIAGNELDAELSGLLGASDGSLYAVSTWGGSIACTAAGSVPGTWGCGAVVRLVPGDATALGSAGGGGSNNGGGGTPGGGTPAGGDSGGGGGDGTTLLFLLAALAGALWHGRSKRDAGEVLSAKRCNRGMGPHR